MRSTVVASVVELAAKVAMSDSAFARAYGLGYRLSVYNSAFSSLSGVCVGTMAESVDVYTKRASVGSYRHSRVEYECRLW